MTATVESLAELVAKYISQHAQQESTFLSPFGEWSMSDPHGLLDAIKEHTGISEKQLSDWVEEAKEGQRD